VYITGYKVVQSTDVKIVASVNTLSQYFLAGTEKNRD